MRRQFRRYLLAFGSLPGLLALPAEAQTIRVSPLVELSRPNAVGTCDDGFSLPGTWTLNDADEPFVAVNPVHPNNIVATWWQGALQDVVAAVSLDAGQTWQKVPIPFTVCSGGAFLAAGDERLAFAPNGDLYAFVVLGNSLATRTTAVSKSTDGGLHWSVPILQTTTEFPNDLTVITADPTDTHFLYAVWDAGPRRTAPQPFSPAPLMAVPPGSQRVQLSNPTRKASCSSARSWCCPTARWWIFSSSSNSSPTNLSRSLTCNCCARPTGD